MTTPAAPVLAEVLALVPPPAQAIDNGGNGLSYLVSSRPCLLYGWAISNIAGAGAERCDLLDGVNTTGQYILRGEIPTGQTVIASFGSPGILCRRGLYIGNVGPDVRAVVYIAQL